MRRVAKERHRLAYMSEGIAKFLQSKYEDGTSASQNYGVQPSSPDDSKGKDRVTGEDSEGPEKRSADAEQQPPATGNLVGVSGHPVDVGKVSSRKHRQSKQNKEIRQNSPQDQIQQTLDLAARLLRESLEVESGGVAFFDTIADKARNAGDGLSSDHQTTASHAHSVPQTSPYEDFEKSGSSFPLSEIYERSNSGPAKVIAEARSSDDTVDLGRVDSEMVRSLIERYTEGNVWYFDEKGFFTSLEQLEASNFSPQLSTSGPFKRQAYSQDERDEEAHKISKTFVCRQLIFLPLWSAETKQWFSGCFVWTHSSIPVFSISSEIGK